MKHKSKTDRTKFMERVAAARCYLTSVNSPDRNRELELAAFMGIFHPEVSDDKVREMRRSLRKD